MSVVLFSTGLSTTVLAVVKPVPFLVIMLIIQATVSTAFFPAALVAVSKLTTASERSVFTGTTIAIGVIVGLGLTPALLGFIADVWNFQIGILFLGLLTMLSCSLLKGIPREVEMRI
jgi:MFS family permease